MKSQNLATLLEVAMENEQPITISMGVKEFNEIVSCRVQDALEHYKEEQERIAKENEQGDLITPKETKAMLHVSDATLWRYVKTGLVEKKQVGGKVYYSRKEITKIMEG